MVSYLGHTSRVNNVSFTHSRYTYHNCGGATSTTSTTTRAARTLPLYTQPHYQLLSSSADGSARMWRYGSSDSAAVVFTHTKHSLDGTTLSLGSGTSNNSGAFIGNSKRTSVSSVKNMVSGNVGVGTYSGGSGKTSTNSTNVGAASGAKDTRNRPFGEAVSHASYFYMDKFAVMVSLFACLNVYLYYCIFLVEVKVQTLLGRYLTIHILYCMHHFFTIFIAIFLLVCISETTVRESRRVHVPVQCAQRGRKR